MDTMPTIEDHLRGRPESVAEMFSQILSTAQDRGHVDVEVLNLLAPREDARFTKVEPLTKRIWHHRFFLTDPRRLDEEFLDWVREACDVGQGAASRFIPQRTASG
jgi:hypothetical protein